MAAMPESPEVQELASFLTAHTTGREVRAVDVLLPKALKTQIPLPPTWSAGESSECRDWAR